MGKLFRTTILGGVAVVLPVAILAAAFTWLFGRVRSLLAGPTRALRSALQWGDEFEIVANGIIVLAIVAACFGLGLAVRTGVGRWMHRTVERWLVRRVPGYGLIKEAVGQFFSGRRTPFSSVCLARLAPDEARQTAFITDDHGEAGYTIFVPGAPNPMSGSIHHLKRELVQVIDVPVEDAMRTIISCGAGSGKLIEAAGAASARDEVNRASP
jgi:uncharacterized membrane protein